MPKLDKNKIPLTGLRLKIPMLRVPKLPETRISGPDDQVARRGRSSPVARLRLLIPLLGQSQTNGCLQEKSLGCHVSEQV